MPSSAKRDRLLPWSAGLVLIVASVGYIGYQMVATNCPVTLPVALIVLTVVPAVYLTLTFIAFTSQA